MINQFQGIYRFLSNFYPARVTYNGVQFPSVEHAYVAAKTLDLKLQRDIAAVSSPGEVKRMGRRLMLRPDWEKVKLSVMEDLVRQKFTNDENLWAGLTGTGNQELIEGNHWGDTFWGVCRGKGQNHLGKILMKVRAELQAQG